MNKKIVSAALALVVTSLWLSCSGPSGGAKLKALIIDGQNNHGVFPKTTAMMKDYLEQTGLFTVDVARTAFTWQGPHSDNDSTLGKDRRISLVKQFPAGDGKEPVETEKPQPDPDFKPDFSKYNVVISNFGWNASALPAETQAALENFVKNGGGFVVIHAASNSWRDWPEFNKMAGLGGWGGRNEKDGPYVYYNDNNELIRDTTAGPGGSHGKQLQFVITVRDTEHPITKGMPSRWLHTQDELYDYLRGPAENLKVLATAYSDTAANASPFSKLKGSGHHQPMAMSIAYGNGRVFHTPMGHADYSMECVGFITLFQRGTEWAASGNVTVPIPSDFPTEEKTSQRKWSPKNGTVAIVR